MSSDRWHYATDLEFRAGLWKTALFSSLGMDAMNYDFSQWVDILVIYGSIVIGVSYSVVVFLVVSGV